MEIFDNLVAKNNRFGLGFVQEPSDLQEEKFDKEKDLIPVDIFEEFDIEQLSKPTPFTKQKRDLTEFPTIARLKLELERCKDKLDNIGERVYLEARHKANPFEKAKHGHLMNRASFKLAEIDRVFGLTREYYNRSMNFADACSAPGGWTDYMLWRRASEENFETRGICMTLEPNSSKDAFEWMPQRMNRMAKMLYSRKNFRQCLGADGTGNITVPENIDSFVSECEKLFCEAQPAVDVFVADGGIDVSENENQQEMMCQTLLLSEILMALETLRRGGAFVCKFFDMFSEYTCFLANVIQLCFTEFCIYKPLSSRPANSERYIVARNYCGRAHEKSQLYTKLLWQHLKEPETRAENLPKISSAFGKYIFEINAQIAMQQIVAFKRIFSYISDPYLNSVNQEKIARDCLEYWRLPSEEFCYGGVQDKFNRARAFDSRRKRQLSGGQGPKRIKY